MILSRQAMTASALILAVGACDTLDLDLRPSRISTAEAARTATERRPTADDRGVISYPNYQVAVARRGDTLGDVAARVGLPAENLASFNGIAVGTPLRAGEVVALPQRVAEPSPATGAATTGPITPSPVDVTTLAGTAIDNAPDTTPAQTAAANPPEQSGQEPIRHQVKRGETAFTISRLYQVPIRSLAEWNGLGSDFAIREGQFLLIPVARQTPPPQSNAAVTEPGVGSETPLPPSAAQPLPEDDTEPVAAPEPVAEAPATTPKPATAAMIRPVEGSIIRAYKKGRNEGIDIKAAPGTPVKAAADGTVAAITASSEGVPIVVVRHPDNLLTVYANVAGVSVKKGNRVKQGQTIAKLRDGDSAFVHFEVRDGFESVDPATYLN